jgi:microsomal dipeptidase-like Zn-dependent dipeptidase
MCSWLTLSHLRTHEAYVLTHLRRIAEVVERAAIPGIGKYDCLALGTDLDGYVHLPDGVGTAGDLKPLARAIQEEFGPDAAEQILNGNARRVLKSGFVAQGGTIPQGRRVPWAPLP